MEDAHTASERGHHQGDDVVGSGQSQERNELIGRQNESGFWPKRYQARRVYGWIIHTQEERHF
jgi:hypothetical protein